MNDPLQGRRGGPLPAWALAGLALATALPQVAHAQMSPALDRVSVWLGGYRADVDGHASFRDDERGLDTGEQKVLSGRKTVDRARLDLVIMESQGISVDYFRVRENQARGATGSFTADGVTYDAAADVALDTQFDVGNFSYRWWFGGADNVFGLGVGAAYYRMDATLNARASLGPLNYTTIDRTNESGWAPLVTLGWRWRLSDAVRLYVDASGSRKNGDELSGSITNAAVGLEYFPWRHVGVGLEYGATRIRLKRDEDGSESRIRLSMHGPAAYLRLRF